MGAQEQSERSPGKVVLSTPTLKSQVKFYRRFLLPTHTGTWPLKTAFGASWNKGLPRRLLKLSPWRNAAQEDLHDLGGVLHKEPEGDNCSFGTQVRDTALLTHLVRWRLGLRRSGGGGTQQEAEQHTGVAGVRCCWSQQVEATLGSYHPASFFS